MHNLLLLELEHDEANLIARLMRNSDSDVKTAILDAVKDALNHNLKTEQGEWVLMSDADGYFCACASCGEWSPTRKQLKYCPNCGEPKKIDERWLKLDYGKNAVNPYP